MGRGHLHMIKFGPFENRLDTRRLEHVQKVNSNGCVRRALTHV